MGKTDMTVRLTPREVADLLIRDLRAECVHEEFHEMPQGKALSLLVFEKYFIRNSSRAALTVVAENFQGDTKVRAIATGSSQHMLFKFDWGASDDFASSVKQLLQPYLIS